MKVSLLSATGYSRLGWVSEPRTQAELADSLARAGVEVEVTEAGTAEDVERALARAGRDTLVWPNAYQVYTRAGSADTRWLVELLEEHEARYIGPSASALRTVLDKHACQSRLSAFEVPVPRFTTIAERGVKAVRAALMAADLSFPAVVKPTSMWDSIGVAQVFDVEELAAHVDRVLALYGPTALVEEYLPSKDLTIGLFFRGGEPVVIPGWYEMTDRDGILEHAVRNMPWGGPKQLRRVEDPAIVEQAQAIVPRAAAALGIRDFTRVDGRLDARGRLRIFDVNGMPSLDYPHTVTLRLVTTVWGGMATRVAMDRLVATIVASAAARHGIEVPARLASNVLPPLEAASVSGAGGGP